MTAPVIQHILVTSPPRKVDQLVFSHDSSRRYHMELRPNSNAEAYICEVKRPEKAKCAVTVFYTAVSRKISGFKKG